MSDGLHALLRLVPLLHAAQQRVEPLMLLIIDHCRVPLRGTTRLLKCAMVLYWAERTKLIADILDSSIGPLNLRDETFMRRERLPKITLLMCAADPHLRGHSQKRLQTLRVQISV